MFKYLINMNFQQNINNTTQYTITQNIVTTYNELYDKQIISINIKKILKYKNYLMCFLFILYVGLKPVLFTSRYSII